MVKFRNNDGSLSAYALACGYLQSKMIDGSSAYYGTDADGVMLRHEGVFHVHTRIAGITHDDNGHPFWVDGRRADWQSFDTLTEARRAFAREWHRVKRHSHPHSA